MDRVEEMKELIRQEIRSISSLEERVAFKDLMEQVFLSLYETNEQMYANLEERIQEELAYDVNHYQIKTCVVERDLFDATHHLMTPMDERDIQPLSCTADDLVDGINKKGGYPFMKAMVMCDYRELRSMWRQSLEFPGEVETEKGIWKATVSLVQSTEYIRQIEHLYQVFIRNGIPWQTVNAPYLYKMADAVIVDLPDRAKGSGAIKKITVDFGKYSQSICGSMVPVWNVWKLNMDSTGFPVPCEDHKNFEHKISIQRLGQEHAYLVDNELEIRGISRIKDKIIILSPDSEVRNWGLYMIRNSQDKKIDYYSYPVMRNEREETFAERFQRKWDREIRTRWELERFIKGFGLEDYIRYQNCDVMDSFPKEKETYSMNSFIEDEIRDTKGQKKLILTFAPGNRQKWMQRDIASFIVSEVQRLYPEYECGGVIL